MKRPRSFSIIPLLSIALIVACLIGISASATIQSKLTIFQTHLEESNQLTPELTTEEMQAILASGSRPVFDVRSELEYSIAHIPGTINLWEKEAERIQELYPDRSTPLVLYCNGPFCGKSKRTSDQLIGLGYTNIRRYQLGIPLWRALGNTVQTDLAGFRYMRRFDRTAIYVDARSKEEFEQGSLPGAVNVQPGEAVVANEDGRLPFWDKGARVFVFAGNAQEARVVATEIAKRAYWNSSYFGGAFDDLSTPELYTANVFLTGVALGAVVRVKANGERRNEPVARYDATLYRWVPEPIELSSRKETVYLVLYGANIRGCEPRSMVTVNVGEEPVPVIYAGPSPDNRNLEEVKVRLPRSLASRGDVNVTLSVDGRTSNIVQLNIR